MSTHSPVLGNFVTSKEGSFLWTALCTLPRRHIGQFHSSVSHPLTFIHSHSLNFTPQSLFVPSVVKNSANPLEQVICCIDKEAALKLLKSTVINCSVSSVNTVSEKPSQAQPCQQVWTRVIPINYTGKEKMTKSTFHIFYFNILTIQWHFRNSRFTSEWKHLFFWCAHRVTELLLYRSWRTLWGQLPDNEDKYWDWTLMCCDLHMWRLSSGRRSQNPPERNRRAETTPTPAVMVKVRAGDESTGKNTCISWNTEYSCEKVIKTRFFRKCVH